MVGGFHYRPAKQGVRTRVRQLPVTDFPREDGPRRQPGAAETLVADASVADSLKTGPSELG
jgi:hypothetical protein